MNDIEHVRKMVHREWEIIGDPAQLTGPIELGGLTGKIERRLNELSDCASMQEVLQKKAEEERRLLRLERDRREAERKAELQAELDEAVREHSELLADVTDPTLRIIMERHEPTIRNINWGDDVECPICEYWPCGDYEAMKESLLRRRATDPYLQDNNPQVLMDGAL